MSTEVRVVHLADYGGSYPGSFIPMIRAAHAASLRRDWPFEAIFSPGADRHPWFAGLRADGIEATVAPDLGLTAMARWLQSRWPAGERLIAHTHFTRFDVPAVLATHRRAIPVIWHLHTPLLSAPRTVATNVVRFTALGRLAERILCVGPEIERSALARGAPRNRTQLLGNGIDLNRFAPLTADERSAARAALGIPSDTPAVLIFAWDWERKGGRQLIEAVAALPRSRELTALVVGAEVQARAAAAEVGCEAIVQALPPSDDVRSLFAACDLFAAPSQSEGMPFSVLEALSVGVPVVASDIPSHRYIGAELPACSLVARTPSALAAAIGERLDQPAEQRVRDLERTRERLLATRSLDRWADAVFRVYDEVLAR